MDILKAATAMRMERQCLPNTADESAYLALYRDLQPGSNVYWNGFGDPPSLSFRAAFNDIEYNRARQQRHELIKGRFAGGNVGWIIPEDLELFAGAYRKPADNLTLRQSALLRLIERQGPLTIGQMKEETKMLVKEITPALHRLQEAFLVFEDQYDGEWDRAWYMFTEMFPDVKIDKYTRHESLKVLLKRFAYRHVIFDTKMAKSFYRLPEKEIKSAVISLENDGVLAPVYNTGKTVSYALASDMPMLEAHTAEPSACVLALHRNDFLVRSNEHWLKEKYKRTGYDTLQYLLIDGEFCGAVIGRFRNGPYDLEDIITDLPPEEASKRNDEIKAAVREVNYGKEI